MRQRKITEDDFINSKIPKVRLLVWIQRTETKDIIVYTYVYKSCLVEFCYFKIKKLVILYLSETQINWIKFRLRKQIKAQYLPEYIDILENLEANLSLN